MCSADSEEMWLREGQKLASTNPRFVARQLSHLPHLLTSAAVSSALSLQTGRADPELRKNTSTQVQNVLKYIISQNPLNSVTTAGVKQALGKISLPTSAGKTLAKSPSKMPASSELSPSVTTTQPSSSTPSTTNTSSPLTASQSKTPVKVEKRSPTGNKDIALSASMAKGVSSTVRHSLHTPEKVVAGKQSKGVTGAKSPMLVGLLEVRKTVCESSHDAVIASQSEGGDGNGDGIATPDEEKNESKDVEKMEEEETDGKAKVDEKQGEKATDGKDSAHRMGGVATKEGENQPQVKETCQTKEKEIIAEEEEKAESKQKEKEERKMEEEEEKMDIQSSPIAEDGKKSVKEKGSESGLVCEEVMPVAVPARDNISSEATTNPSITLPLSSSADPALLPSSAATDLAVVPPSLSTDPDILPPSPFSLATNPPSSSVATNTAIVPPPSSSVATNTAIVPPPSSSVATNTATVPPPSSSVATNTPPHSLSLASHPTTTAPPSSDEKTVSSGSVQKVVEEEEEEKTKEGSSSTLIAPLTETMSAVKRVPLPLQTDSGDSEQISESRKRPHPTDVDFPPSPKKVHLSSPPDLDISSSPPSLPLPSSSVTQPSSLPIPPPTTCTANNTVTKPPGHPPPLLFSPTVTTTKSQETNLGGRKRDNSGVPESILRQLGPGAPLGRVGGVTIQPLLPSSSLSLPITSAAKLASLPSVAPMSQSSLVAVRATPPPPPLLSLSSVFSSSLPPLANAAPSLQRNPAFQTTPITSSSILTPPPTSHSLITGDVMVMSSSSDEALIRELCSSATEDTTAAALASQLGLEFLEPNLLGGLDLMQLVSSPLDEVNPAITGNSGAVGTSAGGSSVLPGEVIDTTHLLSEALISLSNPSTPLLSSSLPPFHPHLFPTPTALISTNSPTFHPTIPQYMSCNTSSPFTPHTPTFFTPQTPSLSSPLTPEILPDIENLASANEADLLEGIPPELAETIQALAQFESPLQ